MALYAKACDLLEREGNPLSAARMYKTCWLICSKSSGLSEGREPAGAGIVLMEPVFKSTLNFEFTFTAYNNRYSTSPLSPVSLSSADTLPTS